MTILTFIMYISYKLLQIFLGLEMAGYLTTKIIIKCYLTPSKVSTLGSGFDFQSDLQFFCHNVKTFYSTKSHDIARNRGFYRVKSPDFSVSPVIMPENNSGF